MKMPIQIWDNWWFPASNVLFGAARVAELVDATDLKSVSRKGVRVRFPPRAPGSPAVQINSTRDWCEPTFSNADHPSEHASSLVSGGSPHKIPTHDRCEPTFSNAGRKYEHARAPLPGSATGMYPQTNSASRVGRLRSRIRRNRDHAAVAVWILPRCEPVTSLSSDCTSTSAPIGVQGTLVLLLNRNTRRRLPPS